MPLLTDKTALLSQIRPQQGPAAVNNQRQLAREAFEALEYPTLKHEEWKYTSIKPLLSPSFEVVPSTPAPEAAPRPIEALEAYTVKLYNGQPELGKHAPSLPDGIVLMELEKAMEAHPELVEAHFVMQQEKAFSDSFQAMNTALAHQGFFLYVPKGKVLDKPLLVEHVSDASADHSLTLNRNLVIVEAQAECQLIERYTIMGSHTQLTNTFTEISIGQGANMDHVRIQALPNHAYQVSNIQVTQAAQSHYANTLASLSAGLVRNNLDIELKGSHSEAFMNGLYLLAGQDHVDNHTSVDHQVPDCYSNELYKGILDERSKAVFNGKIFVREGAQKTNAFQSNKNILLSPNATVDTKPQLEIWADDVKCSHGATVGALDEEPLFYLQSRGLTPAQARSLLLRAFAADVLERVKQQPLRQHIEQLIDQGLS